MCPFTPCCQEQADAALQLLATASIRLLASPDAHTRDVMQHVVVHVSKWAGGDAIRSAVGLGGSDLEARGWLGAMLEGLGDDDGVVRTASAKLLRAYVAAVIDEGGIVRMLCYAGWLA